MDLNSNLNSTAAFTKANQWEAVEFEELQITEYA